MLGSGFIGSKFDKLSRKQEEIEPKGTPYRAARRLVTPIYHAEASAQAEALAAAATCRHAFQGKQAQRRRGGLGHKASHGH